MHITETPPHCISHKPLSLNVRASFINPLATLETGELVGQKHNKPKLLNCNYPVALQKRMAGTGILTSNLASMNTRNNTMAEQRPAAVHHSACKRKGHRRSSFNPKSKCSDVMLVAQQRQIIFQPTCTRAYSRKYILKSTASSTRGCQAAQLHRAWLCPTSQHESC